jgi:hypothetical protein
MSSLKVKVGDKFGENEVIARAENTSKGSARWLVRCSCGTERVVQSGSLMNGSSTSCGCLRIERMKRVATKHGRSRTSEYITWSCMKNRCSNPSHKHYENYGGRGITVCQEWLASFETFLSDMGEKPSMKHTLERKDNSLGYSKDNCCWATKIVQQRNRRTNRILSYEGQDYCLADLADKFNITAKNLWNRLEYGWDLEKALTVPIDEFMSSKTNKRRK